MTSLDWFAVVVVAAVAQDTDSTVIALNVVAGLAPEEPVAGMSDLEISEMDLQKLAESGAVPARRALVKLLDENEDLIIIVRDCRKAKTRTCLTS